MGKSEQDPIDKYKANWQALKEEFPNIPTQDLKNLIQILEPTHPLIIDLDERLPDLSKLNQQILLKNSYASIALSFRVALESDSRIFTSILKRIID